MGNFLFGVFVLMASLYERLKGDVSRSLRDSALIRHLFPLLKARPDARSYEDLDAAINQMNFSSTQREAALRWVKGEIAFSE